MRQHNAWSLLGLGLLIAVAGCAPPIPGEDAEFRMPVEVEDVATGTVEDLVVATGNLRPKAIVTLNIETPGLLQIARNDEGARLAEGMRVSAGDVIARVTGEDARLHARLESTRQALEAAEAHLARRRELHAANLEPEEELQTAEERYENALYNFERSTLDAAKATLTTPIDGTILRLARDNNHRPQADGQLVQPGFSVAEIAPLDVLIADIDLIGPELGRVSVGLAARIRHYAFDDTLFDGEVIRLSPVLDPVKHTFRAEVTVANAERLLRPGMFVEVVIVIEQRQDVVVVSRDAVANRAGKTVVFAMDGQRVSRRDVRLGLGDDDKVQVLDGVAVGDRVVVRGLETLIDGNRVREVGK
ncbi:MAG: efflux RND transporter periplasmic adaptor subunit [Gammaproteobacteria bacterium]|nr:efflux RND transporter periplasmic adaptor subunit [Gammaproteobacteria bacterium]